MASAGKLYLLSNHRFDFTFLKIYQRYLQLYYPARKGGEGRDWPSTSVTFKTA